jgi:hypothetical protein
MFAVDVFREHLVGKTFRTGGPTLTVTRSCGIFTRLSLSQAKRFTY